MYDNFCFFNLVGNVCFMVIDDLFIVFLVIFMLLFVIFNI